MTKYYPDKLVQVLGFEYLDPLVLTRKMRAVQRRTGEDASYVVAKDFCVCVKIREYGRDETRWFLVRVPRGFLTDLYSPPLLARFLIGRVGPHLEASIIHDWLYTAWQLERLPQPTEQQRHFADEVFLAAMREAKVGWKMWVMLLAVHFCGGFSFEHKLSKVFACPPRRRSQLS